MRAWDLSWASAEREGDVPPRVQVWRRGGQVQDDTAYRRNDMDAEFEQPVPQPAHLGARAAGARRA